MKNLSIIILAFLFSSIAVFSQTDTKSILNEAYRLRQENKCEEAISKLNKAIEIESQNASLYLERAECFKLTKDTVGVLKDVRTAFSLNRNDSRLLEKGEFLLRSTGQYEENIILADILIANNQSVSTAYQNRAENKFMLKNYVGALEDSIKASEINPLKEGYRWGLLSKSLKELKKDEIILEYYNRLFDSYTKTLQELASAQFQNAEHMNVNKIREQIAIQKLGESLLSLSLNLANFFEENNLIRRTDEVLNKMVQIKPKLRAYSSRMYYYERKGRLEEASKDRAIYYELSIEDHTKLIAETPSLTHKVNMLISRGNLYVLTKRYGKAIADYEKAIMLDKSVEPKATEKIILAKQKMQETGEQ